MKAPANAFRDALQGRARDLGIEGPVLVLLYLDDIVVAVPRDLVGEVLPLASTAFGGGLPGVPGPGLELAQDKTEAWCPAGGDQPAGVPAGVRWKTDGIVILGAAMEDASHPDALLDAGVGVGSDAGRGFPATHFRDAAAAARSTC